MQEQLSSYEKVSYKALFSFFSTQTMDEKTNKLGIFFAGYRLNPGA